MLYKVKLCLLIIMALFCQNVKGQGYGVWFTFGSTLGQKLQQNDIKFNSKFCPDIDVGLYITGEDNPYVGGGISLACRWINTENIESFSDSKCNLEIYGGPVFRIPFDDFDTSTGIMITPMIGYSASGFFDGDPDVKMGSFSMKIAADLVLYGFSIGAYWRPLKQHIDVSSTKQSSYIKYASFDVEPAFGIRIGYILMVGD